jgi:hypothetical protein
MLAAFLRPDAAAVDERLTGTVIPTGYAKGKYEALVQVLAPGALVPDTLWEIGLHRVRRGKVVQEEVWQVSASRAGTQAVLEIPVQFPPGEYNLVLVGHDTTTDRVVAGEILALWPDPDKSDTAIGSIAVVQPTSAAFARGEDLRSDGSLGYAEEVSVRTDRPTVFVGLVCRKRTRNPAILTLERSLVGASSLDLEQMKLDFAEGERCVQTRDVVPEGVLGQGEFAYRMRVLAEGAESASAERRFTALYPSGRESTILTGEASDLSTGHEKPPFE